MQGGGWGLRYGSGIDCVADSVKMQEEIDLDAEPATGTRIRGDGEAGELAFDVDGIRLDDAEHVEEILRRTMKDRELAMATLIQQQQLHPSIDAPLQYSHPRPPRAMRDEEGPHYQRRSHHDVSGSDDAELASVAFRRASCTSMTQRTAAVIGYPGFQATPAQIVDIIQVRTDGHAWTCK